MPDINFFVLREQEVRTFIEQLPHDVLHVAACRGEKPDIFHPEVGRPTDSDLAICEACQASVACVALALRAEDPDARVGWYGGLGPDDRDDLATRLCLTADEPVLLERAAEAIRLFRAGWTVSEIAAELECCRRTVQRYLRRAA